MVEYRVGLECVENGRQQKFGVKAEADDGNCQKPEHDPMHARGRDGGEFGGIDHHRFQNCEVVIKRNQAAAQGQRHQPEQSRLFHCRHKQVEFSKESNQRRKPGQREQEDGDAPCQEGGPGPQPSEMADLVAAGFPEDHRDDRK